MPGLIQALGHEPRRFEDFTAQSAPSRQACLDGIEAADIARGRTRVATTLRRSGSGGRRSTH